MFPKNSGFVIISDFFWENEIFLGKWIFFFFF